MNPAELSLDQYDVDYDTDEVSVTSTVDAADEDCLYDAENILSEMTDDEKGKVYLIKWTGYAIHDCTWEPPENFAQTNLLHVWNNRKINMIREDFQRMVDDNHDKYWEALEKAAAAKQRRHEKRLKKRKKLSRKKKMKKKSQTIIVLDSDSESDARTPISATTTGRGIPKKQAPVQSGLRTESNSDSDVPLLRRAKNKKKSTTVAKKDSPKRKQSDAAAFATDNDSDVPLLSRAKRRQSNATASKSKSHSREGSADNSSLFVSERQAPKPRRVLPLLQSSSDESSDDASLTSRDSLWEELRARKDAGKASDMSDRKPSLRKSSEKVTTSSGSTKPPVRKPSAQSTTQAPSASILAKSTVPAVGKATTSTPLTGQKAMRTGAASSTRPSGPIKIVNQPKTAGKEWKNGDGLYKKARYLDTAVKRGRREGTPDTAALDFVNGAPTGRPPPRAPVDNPYARRESGIQRPAEEPIPPSPLTTSKLQPFEDSKLPYSCLEWRNGSCPFSAQNCRWLHRSKDNDGNDLPISSFNGTIPPKFLNPPQTCYFWLRGETGCNNTAEQCGYLHENKGWLGSVEGTGPQKIDPAEPPHYLRLGKNMPRTKKLTCWYWFTNPQGCLKPAEECRFAHENTGLLASLNPDPSKSPQPIDPAEQPLFIKSQSKFQQNTSRARPTCYFWNEGNCRRSNCSFEHRYTGWVSNPPPGWKSPPGWAPHFRGLPPVMPDAPLPEDNLLSDDMVIDTPASDHPSPAAPASPIEQPSKSGTVPLSSMELEQKIATTLKLDFDDMFTYNNSDTADAKLDKRALLVFHPETHTEELELLTRWLLIHKVEIFNFWTEGSWETFRNETCAGKTGVVLAHPQFDLWAEIPKFDDILKRNFRLWSIGYQEAYEYDPNISAAPPVMRHERIEIFPHGGIIYITDDVFDKKPQLALKIFELFFAKIEQCRQVAGPEDQFKKVNDGCLIWRLAVRPDFMQALCNRATKDAKYMSSDDPDLTARIKLYEMLSETEYIEQDQVPQDAPVYPDDYYPVMSERRCYMHDLYYSDNNEPGLSPDSEKLHPFATTNMVQYYGGMLIDKRQHYRQYFVVHVDPLSVAARDWKKRIGVLRQVLNPEAFVQYLGKQDRDNRFDFYEWAFPPKSGAALGSLTA